MSYRTSAYGMMYGIELKSPSARLRRSRHHGCVPNRPASTQHRHHSNHHHQTTTRPPLTIVTPCSTSWQKQHSSSSHKNSQPPAPQRKRSQQNSSSWHGNPSWGRGREASEDLRRLHIFMCCLIPSKNKRTVPFCREAKCVHRLAPS